MDGLGLNWKSLFEEDGITSQAVYFSSLPSDKVRCSLKIKDDLLLAGLPFFIKTFSYLSNNDLQLDYLLEFERKNFFKKQNFQIDFELPFNVALTGERLALNLLSRCSSVASYTQKFVEKTKNYNIKVLDTRKTTPGLRNLEKYGVVIGGGFNHRYSQTDCYMVKDNHKKFFGGLALAVDFFKKLNSFYNPLIVEIHSLAEMKEAVQLGIQHLLLDNFSREEILEAVQLKTKQMTIELSGGIRLDNLGDFLIPGVDAISSGSLIYQAPSVDLSLKFERII